MTAYDDLRDQLEAKYLAEFREKLGWQEAQERRTLMVLDDYTPEELVEVRKLQEQWAALEMQGVAEGWLVWDGGYQDGEYCLTEKPIHSTRTKQVPEADREYNLRIARLEHQIKQAVVQRTALDLKPDVSTKLRWI